MKKSGFQMVYEAALGSDAELTEGQKKQIRQILKGEESARNDVEPLLLTQRQTCRALGMSRFTILRMVKDGQLHPVMIRGSRRYRSEEIHNISRTGAGA